MKRGDIYLNRKESRRVYVMEKVVKGELTVRQGAEFLGLSERQVKRLKKGVKEKGVAALAHGNRGRTPKHAITKDTRNLVFSLATQEYKGASAEHMAELLARNHKVNISAKSILRILREKGVMEPASQQHRRRRKSRDRMPKEGFLIQIDASPYKWLEERGPMLHLHGAIDDATSKVLGLYFRPTEDLKGYLELMKQVILNHGCPRGVYSDGHTIFFSPKKDKLSIEEELAGKQVALTQFGRALDELNIIQIHARSPQAKGRIERLWETLQSRLVIELRVANICSMEEANAFLPGFIERFNKRFAVEAADPEPAYMPAPNQDTLEAILCVKEQRIATNGSVISYGGQTYRLIDTKDDILTIPPKAIVDVLLHTDNSIDALYQGKRYRLEAYTPPKAQPQQEKTKSKAEHKPKTDNPWRKFSIPKRNVVEDYFIKNERRHNFPTW